MVVLQHQHARTRRHGYELGRGRHAVAYGRNQGHVVGIGVDQPRRRAPRAFILCGGMGRLDQPRLPLARDAGAPRVLGGNGQGTPGGGVEITNLARNIEQRALRWQHRGAVPFVVGRETNVACAGPVAMLGERMTRSYMSLLQAE
jgi:hypothetical protein